MSKSPWSTDDKCPICRSQFLSSACKHSYQEAIARIEQNALDARVKKIVDHAVSKAMKERDGVKAIQSQIKNQLDIEEPE